MRTCIYVLLALLLLIPVGAYQVSNAPMLDISAGEEPLDLGVYPAPQDLTQAVEKIVILQSIQASNADALASQKAKPENITFSSEELTALLSQDNSPLPFSRTQFKMHSDNSFELSGILMADKIPAFASTLGLTDKQVLQAESYLNLTRDIPVYVQGNLVMAQQHFTCNISRLKIGKISMPADEISIIENLLAAWAENNLKLDPPGFGIESITIDNLVLNIAVSPN